MEKLLISACLLGLRVRYDGGGFDPVQLLLDWQSEGRLVVVCPEGAGGLPTPRPPAEIPGGQGALVLAGEQVVVTDQGEDVSAAFIRGAEQALALVRKHRIRYALLKARSPSCGNVENYDGSFSGVRVSGEGVTAAALRQAGVRVFNEEQLGELRALLGD